MGWQRVGVCVTVIYRALRREPTDFLSSLIEPREVKESNGHDLGRRMVGEEKKDVESGD